jgi:RHS repeat-associated protein
MSMKGNLLSAKLSISGQTRRLFSRRAQSLAITAVVFAAFVLPPITTADAASIWNQQAKDFRVTAAAPSQGLDPAYQAPATIGTSYQAPTEKYAVNQAGIRSILRAGGLRSMLMSPPPPSGYAATVQADSPVAFWQMDDTSGTTMTDTQNNDAGTYQGGFTLGQSSLILPAIGNSVSFNGSTGTGTAPTLTALQGDNTRSIELWFQTSSQTAQYLFDAGAGAGTTNQMFSLIVVPANSISGNPPVNTAGLYVALWGQDIYYPGLYMLDGKRHHVVLELSGNTVWLYVDGTAVGGYFTDQGGNDTFRGSWDYGYLQSPVTLTTTPSTQANPVLIGTGRYVATNPLTGLVDEAAVYSTALTAAQVQNHWLAGSGLPWSPLSLSATAGLNKVTLSWQTPTFNATGITGYVVTPHVGSTLRTPITFNSSATTQAINNLSGGTAYTFTVNAINALGTGIPSDPSSASTPTGSALPLYEDTALADSPAGFWPLGETSGNTANDLTGNANGQYFNSYVQGDTGPIISVPNKATNFGGNNAFVRLNHNANLEPAAVTVEAWIKPAGIPVFDVVLVVSPQPGNNYNSNANGYDLVFDGSLNGGNGKVVFGGLTSAVALPVGVWSYVVGTADANSVRIYVNGKQSISAAGSALNYGGTPNFDALIARTGFAGDLADVAIYPAVLSASQVSAHYAVSGYTSGAVSNLVAKTSTNSASLTWTPPASGGTSAITSYLITPMVGGMASPAITVNGPSTGANIPNLPGAASYTFQVQANNASGPGIAVTSSAVTINSPSASPGGFGTHLYLRAGQGDGQAFANYGFVSTNNAPALATWTIEERLWGLQTQSTTGSHMALGYLSGTTSNPSDQNPIAGLNFNIGGAPLQTYFVWPGGSCAIPSDPGGLPLAFDSGTTTPAHVALSYDGTTVYGFINGTLVCSQATGAAALPAGPFGFMDNDGLAQGHFDEIRVSSAARWTAPFTPPTQEFASDGSTTLLWHFNDYGITKLPVIDIPSNVPNSPVNIIPSTYRDASSSGNHANTVWHSGASSINTDYFESAYSLGQGVTPDELTGSGSSWLCVCAGYSGAPVNHATGEFWHTFVDFNIPGRVALDFTRTYSSLRVANLGPTGYGWTDKYNEYLSFDGSGNATVREGNGSATVFTFTSPSTYTPPPSEHATLVKNGDLTFTLTDTAKNQTVFNVRSGSTSTLKTVVDRHGGAAYTVTLTYNADGTLQKITDPAARTLTFAYQTIGTAKLIQAITDTASPVRTVSFQYGTNSGDPTTYLSLTQVTDVAGGLTRFTYDANHYMLTMTDPNGGVITNTYDASNRISSQQDPLRRPAATYTYANGITTITDPKGNVSQEEYLNGILMSRTSAVGSAQPATAVYGYDPAALATTSVVAPGGETVTATRDPNANVLSSTDSQGRTNSFAYNSFNEPLTVLDPSQVTTTTTYNPTGDVSTISRPLVGSGQTSTTIYTFGDSTHPGDPTKMTDPDNNSTTYTYDTAGNRTSVTDPLGNKTTYAFDTIGRMKSMVTPKGNVSHGHPLQFTWAYTYDNFGNQLTITDPLAHMTTYHFDPNQNLDRVTDADGNVTTKVYDLDNELTQVKRADSPQTVIVTDYNLDGTVLDLKDGKGNPIVTYGYDSHGRVSTITDALGNVTTSIYDAVGNLAGKQDPGGNCSAIPAVGCTGYIHNVANQLVGITYSDGLTPNVSITYDQLGQRTAMTDGTGTSSWTWDSLHRMVSYTNGNGAQVQWIYNLRSLPTTITYPGSLNVIRGYDSVGRWTSVKDWNLNTTTFGYDPNSNLTTETLPTASGVVDTNTFDNSDRLTAISDKKGTTTLFSATYTLDAAGQLTTDSSATSGQGSYKYTPLNQLCYAGASNTNVCSTPPSGSIAYAYDAADNLTQMGATQQSFNNADQLCWTSSTAGSCATPPSGATTYQFDTRGNRTGITPNPGQATTLAYDQANRLTAYAAGSTTSYGYNGDGLRMCKVSGSFTQPCAQTGSTQFVWDTASSLPLLLKDGTTSYVYGPGGLPLEQVTSSATYYLHQDQIGSTRLITDSAGTARATYVFQSYGQLAASTGTITNPMRFAGQYLDAESGFYYLRARYYEPATGQFISRDPMVSETTSAYGYAGGNPLNVSDPSGLVSVGTCGGANGMWWVINGMANACLVNVVGNANEVGLTGTLGLGFGVGLNAAGSATVQVSNASSIDDLGKNFFYFSAQVTLGIGLGVGVFVSMPGAPKFIFGGDFGPSFGAGAEWAGGISWTWIYHFTGWQAAAVRSFLRDLAGEAEAKLNQVRRMLEALGVTDNTRPEPC